MPVYEQPAPQMLLLLEEVKRLYHSRLDDHGVRIDLLVAKAKQDKNGDTNGCALRLHGYQANAIVKVTSYKDRVLGRGDAEIQVDGDMWHLWSREQQMALLDHELEHLEPIVKDVIDDAGMRKTELQRGRREPPETADQETRLPSRLVRCGRTAPRRGIIRGVACPGAARRPRGAANLFPWHEPSAETRKSEKKSGKLKVSMHGGPVQEMDAREFVGEVKKDLRRQRKAAAAK